MAAMRLKLLSFISLAVTNMKLWDKYVVWSLQYVAIGSRIHAR